MGGDGSTVLKANSHKLILDVVEPLTLTAGAVGLD